LINKSVKHLGKYIYRPKELPVMIKNSSSNNNKKTWNKKIKIIILKALTFEISKAKKVLYNKWYNNYHKICQIIWKNRWYQIEDPSKDQKIGIYMKKTYL